MITSRKIDFTEFCSLGTFDIVQLALFLLWFDEMVWKIYEIIIGIGMATI